MTTRRAGRADGSAVRLLVSVVAVAGTLVAWVSLAQIENGKAPAAAAPAVEAPAAEAAAVAPVPAADPVGESDVVDVTASASGRRGGRR